MKCVVLCAGYATRLYPLTLERPKHLLHINGMPIIDHIMERINRINNIDEVIIVNNNKFYNDFLNWKENYSSKKTIKILNEK